MAQYKISFNKPSGKEGDLCFYSRFGIDTYRSGCKHDCIYCYSRSQNKHQYKNWNIDNPSMLDTKWLRKQFVNAFKTVRKETKVTSVLRQKIPIRIGMNSDPFQPIEKQLNITFETIKILNDFNYPYLIFTKSDLVADDKYLKIYKHNSYFQMTITTLNEHFVSKVEQNAPSPQSRINAISNLTKAGFKTAFRINPLFPIYPDGYYSEGIQYNNIRLDYFTFNLVEELLKVKPHCIIVGFLRVCNAIMHDEMKGIGIDLTKYFIKNKKYYSADEIGEYYKRIKIMCDDKGVDFSICFDADGNYDKFKYLWANQSDCCNAKDMTSFFAKTALDAH